MPAVQEPRKPERPARSVPSRDRILRAAKSLFAGRGYENTSTVTIARLAGTSESQLIKHFGSKEGLLEAIFQQSWQEINQGVRKAIQGLGSPLGKFEALVNLTLAALSEDPELKVLLLLEGRHVRKDGRMILLDQGFLEFVRMADEVLGEMHAAGQLCAGVQVETVRSALMGAIEGLLRDQLLAERVDYPAPRSTKQIRQVFDMLLASLTSTGKRPPQEKLE